MCQYQCLNFPLEEDRIRSNMLSCLLEGNFYANSRRTIEPRPYAKIDGKSKCGHIGRRARRYQTSYRLRVLPSHTQEEIAEAVGCQKSTVNEVICSITANLPESNKALANHLVRTRTGRPRSRLSRAVGSLTPADRRFKDAPALKAHPAYGIPHGPDLGWRGVVGVFRRGARRTVLVLGERLAQLRVFIAPVGVALVEDLRQAAPTRVTCKNGLLFRCSRPFFCFDLLEETDCGDIAPELVLRAFRLKVSR